MDTPVEAQPDGNGSAAAETPSWDVPAIQTPIAPRPALAASPLPSPGAQALEPGAPPEAAVSPQSAAVSPQPIFDLPEGPPLTEAAPEAAARVRRSLDLGKALAAVWAALLRPLAAVWRAVRSLLVRILPEDALSGIPSTMMALTALAVPLVIVTAASVVYTRLGRDTQYEALYSQARQIGERAAAQTDLGAKNSDLITAISRLDELEGKFGSTAETQALRLSLRAMLDEMELIRRVDYRPAIIGGLPLGAHITRMAVIDDNLYLLDSSSGSVLHARLTSQGYRLNPEFACSPSAGISGLGQLVDMALWPLGWPP
jgi:hypothetical protein